MLVLIIPCAVVAEGGIGSAAEMLGTMYRDGDPPDYEEAKNWYRSAVELGRLESQKLLSSLEEKCRQVPADD